MAGLLAGCQDVRSPQVVKIGLVAPFEGPSRALGYEVLHGVRLQIRQWNESTAQPKIELVALNDDGNPALAAHLPAQLARDDAVRVILGPPQGHTAMAFNAADLAQTGIPALLLGPVKASVAPNILAYAGTGHDYEVVLAHGGATAVWDVPLTGPGIWLGNPLTLAALLQEKNAYLLSSGPVAREAAVQQEASDLPWAAPQPQHLPADFVASYQAAAGQAPSPAAALAYAAAGEALRIIAAAPDYRPGVADLNSIIPPPIRIQP
jgi:ABC-type branched-subunit amino acid transport system substrate-binding protein